MTLPANEPASLLNDKELFWPKLRSAIEKWKSSKTEIPIIINGEKHFSSSLSQHTMPSDNKVSLCTFSQASNEDVNNAINGALKAKSSWEALSISERCSVFLKAAHLVSTKYRYDMLATTILGQAKNAFQADIDAVCETVDFLKFNVHYAKTLEQTWGTLNQSPGILNSLKFRPLEGFVAAISPFNFTAIAANLSTAPAILGNVVVWKPSNTSILSNWLFYQILLESGLPPGVIQFVPCNGPTFGMAITSSKHLAAVNFTGSTQTFNLIWFQVGKSINEYRTYPRLVGECGGKNFHFVHESADISSVVNCTIRSAFEYSGQKCSACSRVYIPNTRWEEFETLIKKEISKLTVGQPNQPDTFVSAVIDKIAYDKIKSYVDSPEHDPELKYIHKGHCSDETGYFISPTVIRTTNINHRIMNEEIFGPVLVVYVYESCEWKTILQNISETSIYALTGSIFSTDIYSSSYAEDMLRDTAGNLYINDKSTGAVVGQQPFGGSRKSGTNDKSGLPTYLLRFVSPQARKEAFSPCSDWCYDYMK